MKFLQGLFTFLRGAGLIAIGILFLHVEWSFVHGKFSNALNPLVQLFVIGSTLLLPLFWLLLGITLAGYFGGRAIRKRTDLCGKSNPA